MKGGDAVRHLLRESSPKLQYDQATTPSCNKGNTAKTNDFWIFIE